VTATHAPHARHPQLVDCIILCNAPALFTAMWNAIRSWLDPVTASKVQIYGASKAEKAKWQAALRAMVDPADLPKEYGGDSDKVVAIPLHAAKRGYKPPAV